MNNRITRRQFSTGLAGAAATAALAACSKGSASKGGGNKKEITFLNDSAVENTPFGTAISAFEKESGIKVKVQPVPAEFDTKFRTVLSSGAPPDLIKINDDYVKGISATGALLDLNPYIERDKPGTSQFPEDLYNFPKQPDGKHTAWVIAHSPRLFFYNVDLFKKAGVQLPPTEWTSDNWHWDDFLKTAQKLTVPKKVWGGLVYLDTGYEQTFSVNNGDTTGIFSKDGKKFTLASPKGAEAVQWATDLTCKYHVQPNWGDLQSTDADLQLF
ncbi:MAG TPA: extracellular solute-binding protein, partial [Mycobacteriales bacterium]|nr:extracellular solute-binding protein [Mycobacteriales bacterium]